MTWTATLCIAHAPGEDPAALRGALSREGRRIVLWDLDEAPPAGALTSDIVLVTEKLSAGAGGASGPFPSRAKPGGLVLALGDAEAAWADASLNSSEDKPIDARVGALLRLMRIEAECAARNTTFEALGLGPIDTRGLKPPNSARVLHIGGPTMTFASLHAALAEAQIDLRPVLSAGLALDEMETGVVDAVLLDASASDQTARELSLIMRRNSDLALCPVLILQSGPSEKRRPALVGDLIPVDCAPEIVARRLTQLIAENRRRRKGLTLLRRTKAKGQHDARTGLHLAPFVAKHIETLGAELETTGRGFCVGGLRFSPIDMDLHPEDQASLAQQTGSLVARLIRAEDSAAALSDEAIALVFPSTIETEAQMALRRIAAVLTATRYNASRVPEGVASTIDWSVVEPRADQSLAQVQDELGLGLEGSLRSAI